MKTQLQKYGFTFPVMDYSEKIYDGMSEREKLSVYMTPLPFYHPISFQELFDLLTLVKSKKLQAGQVFFWKLVPAISGMTMPIPGNGPVYEKYTKAYQAYQTLPYTDIVSVAGEMFALMQ